MVVRIQAILLALLLAGMAQPANTTGIYKWVDQDGNVHYGGKKPATAEIEEIRVKSAVSSGQAASNLDVLKKKAGFVKEEATDEAPAEGQPTPEQIAEREAEIARINAKNCETARGNLQKLLAKDRVSSYSVNGERTRWSEEQRQNRIRQSREQIAKFCN